MLKKILLCLMISTAAIAAGRITNSDLTGTAAISNANLAAMATQTLKGNSTGGSATPSDLSVATVTGMLNTFTSVLQGLVPASGGGTTNFLRADGTWAAPSGTGVSSISVASANGLAGSSSGGSTPALTLSTTITGLLKGNGTSISAASAGTDYQAAGNYITALTGDVTASGPGSAAATIANLAVTNAKIANSTIDLTAKVTGILPNANTTADPANTASAIVARDASGNFTASTITAALTGNASTASALAANPTDCSASQFANAIAANGNLTCAQPAASDLSNGVTGSGAVVLATSPTLTTPTLGAALGTSWNGMGLSCSATTCTFQITSGKSVTFSNSLQFAGTDGSTLNIGAGGTLAASAFTNTTDASNISSGTLPIARIGANAVTNAKLAQMANGTTKCRTTAGTGDPEDCTGAQETALLSNMVGDSGSGGTKGLVPAPAAGDTAAAKFLKADGTWAVPAGGGGGTASVKFTLEGATVPFTSINGPHYQTSTQSLTAVNISALNSGTSGSTVVQVNQYRSGSLLNSATASLSASSGNPAGSAASLSGTLSLLSGDIITVDVNSVAVGASELSVEY